MQDLTLAAVDGTMLHALPKMVWALWLDAHHHAAKMHLQFNILKGLPARAVLTDGNGNERSVLRDILAPKMRKPTKSTYELICFYFLGWIGDDELTRHLAALPACS